MYAVRFDLPSHDTLYAGKGSQWADTISTAELFDNTDDAAATIASWYSHSAKYGVIVEVDKVKA